MDNEPYRQPGHDESADLIAAEARRNGYQVAREFRLPHGRIADVIVRTPDGLIAIYEVKTVLKDSLIDEAVAKYGQWCNRLYFVVPGMVWPAHTLHRWEFMNFPSHRAVGLVGVYPDSIAVLREPREIPMTDERRRQMQIVFPDALSAGEPRFL
jgi:hypothetical protein